MGRWGRKRLALGAGLVLALFGSLGVAVASRSPAPEAEPIALAPKTGDREASPGSVRGATATSRRNMPVPVRISIPAIGVDAPVIQLGLNPDRTIEVPTDFGDTGWFQPGPEPGEQGAAVIVGHLSSVRGPGVFWRLKELRAGGVIEVHLQGGDSVRFVARSMIRVPKNRFPTDRVYAQTKEPTLRLVTCAGRLNPSTGHHDDNYIVFASIVR